MIRIHSFLYIGEAKSSPSRDVARFGNNEGDTLARGFGAEWGDEDACCASEKLFLYRDVAPWRSSW